MGEVDIGAGRTAHKEVPTRCEGERQKRLAETWIWTRLVNSSDDPCLGTYVSLLAAWKQWLRLNEISSSYRDEMRSHEMQQSKYDPNRSREGSCD